jgi:hypothetical protein
MPTRMPRFSTALLITVCLLLGQGAGFLQFLRAETGAAAYYVSPSGSPTGDGSSGNPWDLQTALNKPIPPGSTIWLAGGTYRGQYTASLAGTGGARISVKPYAGARVTIDSYDPTNWGAGLTTLTSCSFVDFWDLEFMASNVTRLNDAQPSVTLSNPANGGNNATNDLGHDLRYINPVCHDTSGGWGMNQDVAYNNETYGLISYYNGWFQIDRAHGHNLYMHNETGSKRAINSVLFDSYVEGLHVYTAEGFASGITVDGITIFDSGMISAAQPLSAYPPSTPSALRGTYGTTQNTVAGSGNATGTAVFNNVREYFRGTREVGSNYGYANGFSDLTLTNGYFAANGARESCGMGPNQVVAGHTNTVVGNTFVGRSSAYAGPNINPGMFPANYYLDSSVAVPPNQIFVDPNSYVAGRANVTVYNWSNLPSVSVDLSSAGLAIGQTFTVKHVMDFYGAPVLTGTYTGAPITLPMTNLPIAAPINAARPTGPFPTFAVFVLLPGISGPAPTPIVTPSRTPTPPPTVTPVVPRTPIPTNLTPVPRRAPIPPVRRVLLPRR